MVTNTRQSEMYNYISSKKNVTVQELIKQFSVSDMTVRRDLTILESKGNIKRIHGGAIFVEEVKQEIWVPIREQAQKEEKKRIAEKAVSLIKEWDTIVLDAGTTTLEIARQLLDRNNLTVITNGVNIASLLSQNSNIYLLVPGGDVHHSTQSLFGTFTVNFLKTLRVDHAFIGSSGISFEKGLMNSNIAEGEVKKVMIDIANHSFIVADYTKFEQTNLYIFSELNKVNTIITNKELDENIVSQFITLEKPELILV